LWNGGDKAHAMPELQSAVKLAPANFEYSYYLGSAYLRQSQLPEAVAELKRAVGIGPSSAPAWADLGQALDQAGDLAASVDAYAHAVGADPANDEVRNNYAYLLIETRQAERGIAEARKVLEHNASDTSALMNIGYAHLKLGNFVEAEKAYRDTIAVYKYSAAAHYDLGIALKGEDRLEAAKEEFQEAIDLDATLAMAHYSLGITDWQLGDFKGLAEQMRAAIAVSPDYAEAHYMLGIALKSDENYDAAMKELREAIRLDPTTPGPWNTIAQILRIKGDNAGSEQAFAKGTELKRIKEAQLSSAFDEGMRGGGMMNPIARMPQKPVGAPR
jgi:Flp pilus assembly protein TadD